MSPLGVIYFCHTYLTSTISLIANTILIYLIFKKTPIQMKTYSHVLLQTCVFDIFKAVASAFTLFVSFFRRFGTPFFTNPESTPGS